MTETSVYMEKPSVSNIIQVPHSLGLPTSKLWCEKELLYKIVCHLQPVLSITYPVGR